MNQQQAQKLQEIIDANKSKFDDGLYLQLSNQLMAVHNNPPPKYYKLTYVVPYINPRCGTDIRLKYDVKGNRITYDNYDGEAPDIELATKVVSTIHDLDNYCDEGYSVIREVNDKLKGLVSTNKTLTVDIHWIKATMIGPSDKHLHTQKPFLFDDADKLNIITYLPPKKEDDDEDDNEDDNEDVSHSLIDVSHVYCKKGLITVISVELL